MTAQTEDLIERLENHRIILKSGDYDGADLMRAWCTMTDAAQALRSLQAEVDELRRRHEDIVFLRKDDPGYSDRYYSEKAVQIARSALNTGSGE